MRRPAKGFSRSNRSSMADRAGMKERTHWILVRPDSARDISLTMLMVCIDLSEKVGLYFGKRCFGCDGVRIGGRTPGEGSPSFQRS